MSCPTLSDPLRRRLGLSVVCLLSAVGMAVAQPASSGADVPRTPWGAPDLQGVWDVRTVTLSYTFFPATKDGVRKTAWRRNDG